MVGLYCPPKRAVRRDACQHGVPRLFSEPTRPLKVRIDACCGVAPECSVRSNQRVDLRGRQLDTLIAQRRQSADRITQEFQTVFLVGHQATDDHLNGSQRHGCASGGRAAPTCVRPMSLRTRRSKRRASTTSTSLAEAQPLSPARRVVPSLANNAPRNGWKSAGAHRTNLARRHPLRERPEGVSLRRCDPQDRTALDSKAGLGSRLRRRELPHVKHRRECVAKRTPRAQTRKPRWTDVAI